MEQAKIKNIVEAVLLSAEKPMTVAQLDALFVLDVADHENEKPSRDEIRQVLHILTDEYKERGLELKQVASGFRLQVRQEYSDWVGRLWEEKPQRYSRALLETLALIAYRQPITRGEIEEVRGVSVSSNIIKTCIERDWIKVLGHKDVPGRPSLYGTTREFLDYFNLKSLDELPTLAEITDLDDIHPELKLNDELDNDESAASDNEEGVISVENNDTSDEKQEVKQEFNQESVQETNQEIGQEMDQEETEQELEETKVEPASL